MNGSRAVSLVLDQSGKISAISGGKTVELSGYNANKWQSFKIDVNCGSKSFTVAINGKQVLKKGGFGQSVDAVQRVVFRTGEYRRIVPPEKQEKDVPNSGEPAAQAVYYLDNVSISP
jgi:hypothetical protein